MLKIPSENKTQAFEGLAESYDKVRPTYPHEAYQIIMSYWQNANAAEESIRDEDSDAKTEPTIADVGCGTGLFTKAFYSDLQGQCRMIGVEPGKDMLATARQSSPEDILYVEGPAEALPLESGSVDIVTAAQAAQWFDRPKFYTEVLRVVRPDGIVVICENNRNIEISDLLEKHETFLETYSIDPETGTAYSRNYRNHAYAQELKAHFTDVQVFEIPWMRRMPPNDFLSMTLTSTQTQRAVRHIGEERVKQLILENAHAHVGPDGLLDIPYITKLYIARK